MEVEYIMTKIFDSLSLWFFAILYKSKNIVRWKVSKNNKSRCEEIGNTETYYVHLYIGVRSTYLETKSDSKCTPDSDSECCKKSRCANEQ